LLEGGLAETRQKGRLLGIQGLSRKRRDTPKTGRMGIEAARYITLIEAFPGIIEDMINPTGIVGRVNGSQDLFGKRAIHLLNSRQSFCLNWI